MKEVEINSLVWIYVLLEVLIGLFGLIGNIFLVLIFSYDSKLQINRNYYLISLTFANILTCLVEIPLTVLVSIAKKNKTVINLPNQKYFQLFFRALDNNNDTLCYIYLSLICTVRILINYATAAIAFDRLRAVRKPFEYRQDTSKKLPLILIAFCWTIAFIIGFFSVNWKFEGQVCTPKHKFHGLDVILKRYGRRKRDFEIFFNFL